MCHFNWTIAVSNDQSVLWCQKGFKKCTKSRSSHFLEELLYVCAGADLLRQGVKHVKSEVWRFDLVILWRKGGHAVVVSERKLNSHRRLTFPLGRPRSFRAWKIPFSVFPDANVRVMLKGQSVMTSHKNSARKRNDQTFGASSYPLTGIFPFMFVRKHIFIQLNKKKKPN